MKADDARMAAEVQQSALRVQLNASTDRVKAAEAAKAAAPSEPPMATTGPKPELAPGPSPDSVLAAKKTAAEMQLLTDPGPNESLRANFKRRSGCASVSSTRSSGSRRTKWPNSNG
jgi:hypothetical protein